MKVAIRAAKEESRGVFWIIDDELLAFPFDTSSSIGVSKSGQTYNHKRLWDYIRPKGCNVPFDYYPRGRVELNNRGEPIIYMNPNIGQSWIPHIRIQFGLRKDPKIFYDNSEHYRCHLDEGYKKNK